MFGIGLPEMILILALALIVVGPDKLPDLARSIAKGVIELKKTVSTLKEEFADENPFDSVKPEIEQAARSLKDQIGDPTLDSWDETIEQEDFEGDTAPDRIVEVDGVSGTAVEKEDAVSEEDGGTGDTTKSVTAAGPLGTENQESSTGVHSPENRPDSSTAS